MKIIETSNFDLDYVDDVLICENVNNYYGSLIVDFLNKDITSSSPNYYMLKEDNYELHKWEP
jgi:hypothetical protein